MTKSDEIIQNGNARNHLQKVITMMHIFQWKTENIYSPCIYVLSEYTKSKYPTTKIKTIVFECIFYVIKDQGLDECTITGRTYILKNERLDLKQADFALLKRDS